MNLAGVKYIFSQLLTGYVTSTCHVITTYSGEKKEASVGSRRREIEWCSWGYGENKICVY